MNINIISVNIINIIRALVLINKLKYNKEENSTQFILFIYFAIKFDGKIFSYLFTLISFS